VFFGLDIHMWTESGGDIPCRALVVLALAALALPFALNAHIEDLNLEM
jgi:hypothetical protein